MAETKYASIFERKSFKTVKSSKKSKKAQIKENLFKVKKLVKKLREEEEMSIEAQVGVLDNAINTIEDIITDVIDSVGANNAVVDELIDTVEDLSDIADDVEVGIDIEDAGEDEVFIDDVIGYGDEVYDDMDDDDDMMYDDMDVSEDIY